MPVQVASFETFLESHSSYKSVFDRLSSSSRLLSTSAQLVYELHGEGLGSIADEILSFVEHAYPPSFVDTYIARLNRLAELQRKFDRSPGVATVGDPTATVPSDAYALALLLSIVLTNNRFEIMEALRFFLHELQANKSNGTIASIGAGTGYELKLAAELLPDWTIETYDTDEDMHAVAKQLLKFFNISKQIDFQVEFPLVKPTNTVLRRYDAIILCEVIEHLAHPMQALQTLKECLNDAGRMFVTMAINMAQEDHIYLYPNIESCRQQLREAGFQIARERISPQTIMFLPENREQGFKKGNYIAIVEKLRDR